MLDLTPRKNRDTESPIQAAIVVYLRRVLPDAIVHHSPNEGVRGGKGGLIDGHKRKASGVLPGFPDILIFVGGSGYCLEVKSATGKLSTIQRAVQGQILRQGIPYAVVRSIDDARDVLALWGIKTIEASRG